MESHQGHARRPGRPLWRTLQQKLILDFSGWETDAFDVAFSKLLRGLKQYYGPPDPPATPRPEPRSPCESGPSFLTRTIGTDRRTRCLLGALALAVCDAGWAELLADLRLGWSPSVPPRRPASSSGPSPAPSSTAGDDAGGREVWHNASSAWMYMNLKNRVPVVFAAPPRAERAEGLPAGM